MNIKVNRKSLLDALRFGGMVAGKCKTIPILDTCKVAVKGEKMVVTSTDNEITIAKKNSVLSCDVEHAEFCVVPSDLTSLLSVIRDEEVSLEIDDKVCILTHSRGTAKVSVLPASDFPTNAPSDNKTSFTMDANKLKLWLDTAKSFVADDPLRPALTGMCLSVENGEIWGAASNAHKLFIDSYVSGNFVGIDTKVIIPSKVFGYASTILDGCDKVTVQIEDRNISFVVSDAKINARIVDGSYPKVRTIIPSQSPIVVEVNTADFSDSISRIKLFADKATMSVKMEFSEDGVKLSSFDLMTNKSCEDFCEVLASDGGNITICSKVENLEAVISKIKTDTFAICMTDSKRAMVFYEADNKNKVFLVMPIAPIK